MRRTRERIQGNLRMFTPHTIDEEDVFVFIYVPLDQGERNSQGRLYKTLNYVLTTRFVVKW